MFAIGDVANIPDPAGGTLPQLGSVAQQSGKWAGKNIRGLRDGSAPTPFEYHDKGIMAMVGRNAAVAESAGIGTNWRVRSHSPPGSGCTARSCRASTTVPTPS